MFCHVLWRAVNRYSGSRAPTTGPVMLAWELDGRRFGEDNRLVNRIRRIRVSWLEVGGKLESICIILVGNPSDGCDNFTFLGREALCPQVKLDLVGRWIEVCNKRHYSSCADELGTIKSSRDSPRLRTLESSMSLTCSSNDCLLMSTGTPRSMWL